MSRSRIAKSAPAPRKPISLDDIIDGFHRVLREEFCLDPLPPFSIVVEGKTDVRYLERAAELVEDEDILAIPSHLGGDDNRIAIVTPGSPTNCDRGGVSRITSLARALEPYLFRLNLVQGVALVFDNDRDGRNGLLEVENLGYKRDVTAFGLDPAKHPNACWKEDTVIEDLLSLGIQRKFFDRGGAWCSAVYQGGSVKRYLWHKRSKGALSDFVCSEGTLHDFEEVVRLLRRIRRGFGLPTREDSV
jgi:hypothetical protein